MMAKERRKMGLGYMTNDPWKNIIFPYSLSGDGYTSLIRLCAFYKEDSSKVIDRLIKEKAASVLGANKI